MDTTQTLEKLDRIGKLAWMLESTLAGDGINEILRAHLHKIVLEVREAEYVVHKHLNPNYERP